jgi:hypothetical protein
MLILTATHFRSRSDPSLSEWTACNRPLGVWASVWLIRVFLASSLSYWEFRRDRVLYVILAQFYCSCSNNFDVLDIPLPPRQRQE